MQKLTGKYLFFKTVIHLLFLLMTLVFSIPAFYLFKSGDNSVSLTVRCVSSLSFVVLALFWHYVIRRSNLSKISKGAYLAGELLPITFWTVVGNLILYIPSGSLVPPEPKWYAYPLFRLFLSHKQSALRQLTADPFVCPHPFPALRTEKKKGPFPFRKPFPNCAFRRSLRNRSTG